MENQFEGLSDKLLFKIITKVYHHLLDDSIEIFSSSKFNEEMIDSIGGAIKPFGFNRTEYVEDEYIFEVIRLNLPYIKTGSLNGKLERPQLAEYEFDTDVTETVYQSQTWRNTVSSYSDPYYLIRVMYENGDFDYYDGREVDTEIFDSTTESIQINKNSFRQT